MFIAHDDNWGSNYCIPRRYLHTKRICSQLEEESRLCPEEIEGVVYAIGTIPQAVKISPIQAEAIGVDYLFTILPQMVASDKWNERLKQYAGKDMLVLRPILISGADYAKHLKAAKDWTGNKIRRAIIRTLKEYLKEQYYWLIELSVPELFSANRRKVGEVLIRANKEIGIARDFGSFVIARLPENFVLYDGGGPSNPRYQFVPSGTRDHIELYDSQ